MELISSIEPEIDSLMTAHLERREHWYAHEYVPWEEGRSYNDEPWQESDCSLSPEVRTALEVNLLTEDNLPFYHSKFTEVFGEHSFLSAWSKLWTAEEGQHAIAIRSYLMTSRNCDPKVLEDHRMATIRAGWPTTLISPIDIFNYTAAQELATRISHRNAGALADDEIAHNLMRRVAADENHHMIFYRGVVTALLAIAPNVVLPSMYEVYNSFEMPGTGIPKFQRKALGMAKLGIYNIRIHAEQVLAPLLKFWKIDEITGLDGPAAQAQENLMAMVPDLIEKAEVFEKRVARMSRV